MNDMDRFLIRSDYYLYTRWRFKKSFGFDFIHNWHFRVLCTKLEEIITFEQKKDLVINIPPGSGKSEIVTIGMVAYGTGLDPSNKFIVTSYGLETAEVFTAQAKDILNEPWHQELFPCEMDRGTSAKKHFKTKLKGESIAAGTGGKVTGFRFGTAKGKYSGIGITDDPLKASDSSSDAKLKEAELFQTQSLANRKMTDSAIKVVVMQRLHEVDVAGCCLKSGWDHLCLPAMLTLEQLKGFCDEVGEDYRTTDSYKYGDVERDEFSLWHWKWSLESLREMRGDYNETGKKGIGSFVYSGQYMQVPSPDGGGILKDAWIDTYTVLPPVEFKVFTCDTAWDEKTSSDYSVIQCWAKCAGGIYLVDQIRGKWQFHELKKRIVAFYGKHRPRYVYVENKQSGIGIIQELKREHMMPIKKMQALKDKYSRAQDASPSVECGLVYFPHESIAPWVKDLRDEIKSFPVGKHDDQVDTLVYAVLVLCVNTVFSPPTEIDVPSKQELEKQIDEWFGAATISIGNPWME